MTETAQDWRTMPAGRELDAVVAEQVMGWTVARYVRRPFEGGYERRVGFDRGALAYHYYENKDGSNPNGRKLMDGGMDRWSPSTDIAAAWQVLQAMQVRGYSWEVDAYHINQTWRDRATFWPNLPLVLPHHRIEAEVIGIDTAPLAICRAALEAVEATP